MRADIFGIAAMCLACFCGAAAAACPVPLPKKGTSVLEYLRTVRGKPETTLARQVGDALNDLVEYSPMNCSDSEPDDSYRHFTFRESARDAATCRWVSFGVVPPHAAQSRLASRIRCVPAKASIGGWNCQFTFRPKARDKS